MLVEVSLDYIMREDPSTVVSISGQDAELEKWREGQQQQASLDFLTQDAIGPSAFSSLCLDFPTVIQDKSFTS